VLTVCGLSQTLQAAEVSASHATLNVNTPLYRDATQPVEARVEDLLARMTLDQKIGQMTQSDYGLTSPADAAELGIGSLLSGGDAAPDVPSPAVWADRYDGFQSAMLSTPLKIPMLFGIDAVHGQNYIGGSTIFPHNVGLGSTRDPDLAERIGRATALETAATGLNWTFAPCVAVTRNDRWGRTYESFGETPDIATAMTSIITGLQGTQAEGSTYVMATAKHFIGDGGTEGGVDRGQTNISEDELRAIHLPPFREAIRRNVGSMMVSFSSYNGTKMHAHRYLLTDMLKGELGFNGFVVSDWNGLELNNGVFGISAEDVRSSVNAGVDMFMVPGKYRRFIELLREEVRAGNVSMARIDDATRRILRKKFEFGLFERPFTDRSLFTHLGSDAHRKLAREAVQKSQVLLKNADDILPLPRNIAKIFVAGKSADNIGYQSGGWTMEWQGGSGATTQGTTILQGIKNTVSPQTNLTFSKNGDGIDSSYTAAIAVLGERPYAEVPGDRKDELKLDKEDLEVLAKLKASGVPVVAVLVSGRPLDISEHLPSWSAFLEAWLPGSEGQGVADVLFGIVAPTGKLPLSWMQNAAQQPINVGDGKTPLFPFGYGLTYAGFRASN